MKEVIIRQIAGLEDPQTLQSIIDFLANLQQHQGDGWSDLPHAAKQDLRIAMEESQSDDASLFVSHEQVFKKYEQWLKR